MVLEYPANHTFWSFSEPPKEKKAGWNSNFMWPYFCDGTLFQNLRKNSCFRAPHREKLFFGKVSFPSEFIQVSGMWTQKCHLFICAHELQKNKSNKNQTLGNKSIMKSIMENSAPDYVLGRCNYEKYHCDTSCHILRMTISSCCPINTDLV